MAALFGTAVACLGLAVWAAISSGGWPTALMIVGGTLYLVGTIGVTIACNVPLNDGLATLHPQDAGAASRWAEYVTKWTAWNHVRTVAALDRKSTRLNSSHANISYAVFCLKKKKKKITR